MTAVPSVTLFHPSEFSISETLISLVHNELHFNLNTPLAFISNI